MTIMTPNQLTESFRREFGTDTGTVILHEEWDKWAIKIGRYSVSDDPKVVSRQRDIDRGTIKLRLRWGAPPRWLKADHKGGTIICQPLTDIEDYHKKQTRNTNFLRKRGSRNAAAYDIEDETEDSILEFGMQQMLISSKKVLTQKKQLVQKYKHLAAENLQLRLELFELREIYQISD